jgi:hypothetical protein
MNGGELFSAEHAIEFGKRFLYRFVVGNVVSGREEVGCIQANTYAARFPHPVSDKRDLLKSMAETGSLTRGYLERDFGFHRRNCR